MNTRRRFIWSIWGLTALPLWGCALLDTENDTRVICTAEARAGITVRITDAETGQALTNAHVTARDGAYLDTVFVDVVESLAALAHERAGVYEVTVEREGYKRWHVEQVEVRAGVCHVLTHRLEAELEAEE